MTLGHILVTVMTGLMILINSVNCHCSESVVHEIPFEDKFLECNEQSSDIAIDTDDRKMLVETIWPRNRNVFDNAPFRKWGEEYSVRIESRLAVQVLTKSYIVGRLLKKSMIPSNLEEYLHVVQGETPSKSRVYCRYEINRWRIQITFAPGSVYLLLIPPDGKLVSQTLEEFCNNVILHCLIPGEQMIKAKFIHKVRVCEGLEKLEFDYRKIGDFTMQFRYFAARYIYTNGKVVGVRLNQYDGLTDSMTIKEDDPWF